MYETNNFMPLGCTLGVYTFLALKKAQAHGRTVFANHISFNFLPNRKKYLQSRRILLTQAYYYCYKISRMPSNTRTNHTNNKSIIIIIHKACKTKEKDIFNILGSALNLLNWILSIRPLFYDNIHSGFPSQNIYTDKINYFRPKYKSCYHPFYMRKIP